MSQKREQKIHVMKVHEEQKERQLQKEHERLMHQMHEKAKNITLIELEKQKEVRKKEEEHIKKREEIIKRKEQLVKEEGD